MTYNKRVDTHLGIKNGTVLSKNVWNRLEILVPNEGDAALGAEESIILCQNANQKINNETHNLIYLYIKQYLHTSNSVVIN